jgi:hypothetical protein
MANTADTIDHTTLAHLVEAGAVHGAEVIGHGQGWGVVVKYGKTERALAARRGAVRSFRKFETLVAYLKELGISQYQVNAADFDANALKTTRSRPDAAERMKRAFEADAQAQFLRAKVVASLADPRSNVEHAQVMDDARALLQAKRHQRAAKPH